MSREETERKITAAASSLLVGKTVARVYYMNVDMAEMMGWNSRPVVIEFNDGTVVFCAADEESNGPGVLQVDAPTKPELCLGRLPIE